jgi:Tfp pilus assembly PilM family ATPase
VNENFFSEIKKSLDFYISASQDDMISYCLVTGGASLSYGFLEGLTEVVGIEPTVINPFEAIEIDKKNIPEDRINDIAYYGAVVIGLGMRTLND